MSKQSKRPIKGQDASEGKSFLSATPSNGSANANTTPEATPSVPMTEALLKSISAAVAEEGKRILLSVIESFGKLEAKVDNMMKLVDDVAATTAALATRQEEAETCISCLEDDHSLLVANKELRDKVIELECRQRCKNIRILNLKESTEGNDPTMFFEAFIPKLLQLPVTTIPIDRAHRGFGIPGHGRPRAVVLKLQRSRDVAKIRSAVKRLGNPQYEGRTLRLVPDTPPEVRIARRAFNTVCAELFKRDIRFRMAYPAILSFEANGGQKSFKDPNKAEAFVSSLT
ncbi:unnamed protein product [Knipowitschia caucasica]